MDYQSCVEEFMQKFDLIASQQRVLSECDNERISTCLWYAGQAMVDAAKHIETGSIPTSTRYDVRLRRAALMQEEFGEVLIALAKRDTVALADGLADLLYVIMGMAVQFDIPLQKCFEAVHASNMTKEKSDSRLREKGNNYVPPDIEGVLRRHYNASAT